MEPFILALQARILSMVGIGWIIVGLWMGQDPVTVTWRAAVAAFVAMVVTGFLLRIAGRAIAERLAEDQALQAKAMAEAADAKADES